LSTNIAHRKAGDGVIQTFLLLFSSRGVAGVPIVTHHLLSPVRDVRTHRGANFLAGESGPMSMWADPEGSNGYMGGGGICVIDEDDARAHAERAGLPPEAMRETGFTIDEG
jgi:hypothetical protein